MPRKEPIITEIAYKTWLINEFGCDNMYVLEGTQKALVIDAGMGYCHFRAIVESLTDKPYDVAITHAHPDHIGMIRQFDRIYINRAEVEQAPARTASDGTVIPGGETAFWWMCRKDFDLDEFRFNNRQHLGNPEIWAVTEDMICRGENTPEIVYIEEGFTFDLGGGRLVTAYDLPGHSPGHMIYIDEGQRIAFVGDSVIFNNGTSFHAASTHIRYLKKFLSMYGTKYDRIFTGHSAYCGKLNVKSEDIRITQNIIEAYRALLRGDANVVEIPNHLHPERIQEKVVYGEGALHVEPNYPPRLWEYGEEHIIP